MNQTITNDQIKQFIKNGVDRGFLVDVGNTGSLTNFLLKEMNRVEFYNSWRNIHTWIVNPWTVKESITFNRKVIMVGRHEVDLSEIFIKNDGHFRDNRTQVIIGLSGQNNVLLGTF